MGLTDPQITSRQNPKVKWLRSLRQRKVRRRDGRFLIEGIRIVEEALASAAPVEILVYSPDWLVSERAQALVESVAPPQRLALSGDVFSALSERDRPQGIAAVVRAGENSLSDITVTADMLAIVACQLRDPGNLGSIIRTADAIGASGVIVLEPSVDVYDPQTVRASMGSLFSVPVVCLDVDALTSWLSHLRSLDPSLQVVASSAHGDHIHYDVDYCRPVVLLMGNERQGLPAAVRHGADVMVRLPMVGSATSLNVSAATAALVYEMIRQRQTRDRA